jgi:rod shape-determining protein MreC
MVADVRFHVTQPLRSIVATALYPIEWLAMQPLLGAKFFAGYFQSLQSAQHDVQTLRSQLTQQMQKATIAAQLQLENQRLRQLLDLQQRPETSGVPAEVLYDSADPYTRKIVIDKGSRQSIHLGSPVLDESGVVGQVTRLYPMTSEITLLIDRDQAIPVLNTRTGARSVAYGDPVSHGGTLDLRFMAANADIMVGDLLTTSGIDGVYPAGLPVAKIGQIERRADTAFAKIHCIPIAKITGASHVMVLNPLVVSQPNTLTDKPITAVVTKKGVRP